MPPLLFCLPLALEPQLCSSWLRLLQSFCQPELPCLVCAEPRHGSRAAWLLLSVATTVCVHVFWRNIDEKEATKYMCIYGINKTHPEDSVLKSYNLCETITMILSHKCVHKKHLYPTMCMYGTHNITTHAVYLIPHVHKAPLPHHVYVRYTHYYTCYIPYPTCSSLSLLACYCRRQRRGLRLAWLSWPQQHPWSCLQGRDIRTHALQTM